MSAQDEPSGTAPQPIPDISPQEGGEQQASTVDVAPTAPAELEEQCGPRYLLLEQVFNVFQKRLDWKEVIELQTFRFAATGKFLFLEQMPPIEVFVGMDAIRASAEEVPGLPTRQELQQWLVEHDAIEKETENLDLLGIRLSWDEFRSAAWIDRRTIIADLKTFLDTRARWTPAVYEEITISPPPAGVPNRRASLTSLASVASDTLLASAGFSRSARFKLAEILSRDAAQFSARITSLRHSKISAAGKKLDKLIDTSRKPVPEDLLDEQDRLEEKGIAELEHVGKFVMNAVMQWRKADEIYVESMKDQAAAQALWDDIEAAKFQHPTARQSTSFVTRAEALIKRLILRGDPASPTSAFPQPTHVLFPEHKDVNESVVQTLSSEVSTALELARKVEAVAKEYRLNYEAVHRVETLVETASGLCNTFTSVIERLEKGVSPSDGDGTPPNLMSETCLEPTRHGAFLALLPAVLKEQEIASDSAAQVVRSSRGALLGLDRPGIDPAFKTKAAAEFQRLSTLRGQAQWTRDDVTTRVGRLREARKIWNLMDANLNELEDIRREIGEAMEKHRWQQELNANGAPPTPDSFSAPLPADSPPTESVKRLDDLSAKLTREIDIPLAALSRTLEAPLNERLSRSSAGLKCFLEQVRQMETLLQSVKSQAAAMGTVRDDFNDLQTRIDDLKMRVDTGIEEILAGTLVASELSSLDGAVASDMDGLRAEVKVFTDSLPQRVPFVSRGPGRSPTATHFVKRRFSSIDLKLAAFDEQQSVELPFDLQSLDDAVRADSNSYAMKLGGELQSLEQHASHFQLAQMAKDVDVSLSAVIADINDAVQQLSAIKSSLTVIAGQTNISQPLADLAKDVEDVSQARRTPIARSFSPIRELLRRMEAAPGSHDPAVHESMYLARLRAVDDAELRFKTWTDDADALTKEVAEAQRVEAARLEAERIAEEQRLQAERERIAAEEAERIRLERERLEEEERLRLEEERLAEERRLQAEKERIAAEEAAQALLAKQKAEEEERQRVELARLEEERRLQADRERIAAEEAERARLERERLEMEAKLRLAEEQLAEERRLQAERARLAAEQAERERLERERLEKEERERVEEERRLQAEKERVAAEEAERARLAAEKAEQDRLERERVAREERERVEEARQLQAEQARIAAQEAEKARLAAEKADELQNHIFTLRKRLRTMNIEGLAGSSAILPAEDELKRVIHDFFLLCEEVATLPPSAEDPSVDGELSSLRAEVTRATQLVEHLENLAKFSEALHLCDAALSDLLEHIDTYPLPMDLPAEEQLTSRLAFTTSAIERMMTLFAAVKDDERAIAERDRTQQTWSELEEMAKDRIVGKRSRPVSVSSSASRGSGRNSRSSLNSRASIDHRPSVRKSPTKAPTYSGLSASATAAVDLSPNRKMVHVVRHTRRNAVDLARTTSLTPSTHVAPRRSSGIPAPHRDRTASPSVSDASSYSRSIMSPSSRSSSVSTSTWSRAPRYSLPPPPKTITPKKAAPPPRKKYVANPKNKLDVAVGEVVNKLPVGISIEGVSESWKDQSGKYWIGDQDPKLCFCRILRSQTVMVRVGGGWTELSKFIRGHFADSFRLFETSPPRPGAGEAKWISSATLLEASETETTPPRAPHIFTAAMTP
ncbi:hypothetical protein B0H14DRAFT_3560051 [Mycena olivaceomarginata]|nr:hypothetical protein B0H14DRAFT_3560051 [Mycena olivaceomarginata]